LRGPDPHAKITRKVPSLYDLDLRGLLAFYGGASGFWAPAMIALTVIGSGWTAAGLVPMLWHRRTRGVATALSLAVAAQALLVWSLKAIVGRVRPWIALGLPPPIGTPRDGSFPSGHAAGSFCVAAFLVVALPAIWRRAPARSRALGVAALVLAGLIASSRVYLGAHFPADVVAGACLGTLVGVVAARAWLSLPAHGVLAPRSALAVPVVQDGVRAPVEAAPERG
jgi:undecaprenyl-diphosphatase